MSTIHRLKTIGRFWDAIQSGEKNFEVRLNDRGFQTGDILELMRLLPNGDLDREPYPQLKPRLLSRRITFILQGGQFGLDPLWCVMGISELEFTK